MLLDSRLMFNVVFIFFIIVDKLGVMIIVKFILIDIFMRLFNVFCSINVCWIKLFEVFMVFKIVIDVCFFFIVIINEDIILK